jgi:hypothetical protein
MRRNNFALRVVRGRRVGLITVSQNGNPGVMLRIPVEFSIGVIFFASGAAALIFEIVWLHRAGLVFGNDLRSTSLVLSTYMGGLALGNAWLSHPAIGFESCSGRTHSSRRR